MARRPKGSIIQPLPSWNMRQMSGAASSTGPLALGNLGAVGLINNATRGEWLVVWDVRIVVVPNPIPTGLIISDLSIGTGRNAGSLIIANNSSPLTSQTGQLPGTTWTLNSSTGNAIGNIFNSVALITSGTYAYYLWDHEWPVAAIAPGDSLIAYSDANAYHDFGVSFLYEYLLGGL